MRSLKILYIFILGAEFLTTFGSKVIILTVGNTKIIQRGLSNMDYDGDKGVGLKSCLFKMSLAAPKVILLFTGILLPF